MMYLIKQLLKKNKLLYEFSVAIYNFPRISITFLYQIYYSPFLSLRKLKKSRTQKDLIVSFTSFSKRIKYCAYVVESILAQKTQPEKIVLWLSKSEFLDKELPKNLKKLKNRGLEIEFVEEDLGPHTKYFYAFKKYSEKTIITVDDDIIYPKDMIGDLLNKFYATDQKYIVASLAREIKINNDKLTKYNEWNHNYNHKYASHLNLALGVYGVLYPPKSLYSDWSNTKLIKLLSYKADDIWLKFMELINNKKVISLNKSIKRFRSIIFSQSVSLSSQNVLNSRNDEYIQKLLNHYNELNIPELLDKSLNENFS